MGYPAIDDPDFYRKLLKRFRKYEIKHVKTSMSKICFPKEYQLQPPQKFVEAYLSPKTPYKDLLVFHRIGAGKTCTAIRVGEKWKSMRRIIVVLPAALREGFRDELRSQCAGNVYLTLPEREKLAGLHPTSDEYKAIIKTSNARIDKWYDVMSNNRFVKRIAKKTLSLKNAVLIVDEVQNMVSAKGTYYAALYKAIHNAPRDLRVVILSATPMFDKPLEISLTLNLLRLPKPLPIGRDFEEMFIEKHVDKKGRTSYTAKNLDLFKSMIRGYVSYFRGAPPHAFPRMNVKAVKCPMQEFQLRSYLTVNQAEESINLRRKFHGEIEELPNNFFIGTRMISNIAFPNHRVGKHGWGSLDNKTLDRLPEYSGKFASIMRRIKRARGPVFVYSNFKEYGGIKSFARVLAHFGYSDYIETGEGYKRYAIWSGDVPGVVRSEIRNVFNRIENADGSRIRVILGSPSIKEGVSFMNIRQVHIIEPYWNRSRIEQVIGRASRFCSHKYLEEEDREVDVFLYIATHPEIAETVDQYILDLSLKKDSLIKAFEGALKSAAVDCLLNRKMGRFEDNPPVCVI
jgi:superfamily II DNA or RNA helicase